MTKQHKKDAIRYLTNNTKLEKEAIIDLISVYAQEYTLQELRSILEEVYPDLAAYLDEYSFPGNNWLDAYFTEYRYSKVINRVSPELRETAQQQAVDHDFLKLLPRIAVVDSIPKDGTFLFFVDAMGVEFIPYIVQKCREYDLKITITVSHCELPSLTRCNKDFFESYPPEQRTKVTMILRSKSLWNLTESPPIDFLWFQIKKSNYKGDMFPCTAGVDLFQCCVVIHSIVSSHDE